MQLVLTHVNSSPPDYVKYCIEQIRIWNPDIPVTFIGQDFSKEFLNICTANEILVVDYNWLKRDEKIQNFLQVSWYDNWGTPNTKYPSPPKFVQGTSERLYALEAWCRQQKLSTIFHIENDVLIYCNLYNISNTCSQVFDKMAITPMADKDHTFAFTYIPHYSELTKFCEYNTKQLSRGNDVLVKEFGLDMVHEMSIVKVYKDHEDGVDFFPILPTDTLTNNFMGVFDPASWGQYLGGTNNHSHGDGYAGNHHIIGREILSGKYKPEFVNGQPYVDGYPIHNLHIHSKQLNRFLS